MRLQHALLGGLLCLGTLVNPARVGAHQAGLSLVTVQAADARLVAEVVFDRRDLDPLFTLDADSDGALSVQESARAGTELAPRILELNVSGQRLSPATVVAGLRPGGGVYFRMSYRDVPGGALTLRSTLLRHLPRGHRQHLKVVDGAGVRLASALLDVRSPSTQIDLSGARAGSTFLQFLSQGVRHIWAGPDHILFLVTLLLPAVFARDALGWRPVDDARATLSETLKSVTAFTVAHSITLSLAVLGLVSLPDRPVEVFIALSVGVTALYNLFPVFDTPRWHLAFGFGLLHGLGFASVLQDLGMAPARLAASLAGFNLGVEAGQLLIVLCVVPLAVAARKTRFYRRWVFTGGSVLAVMVSAVWIVERTFDLQIAGF